MQRALTRVRAMITSWRDERRTEKLIRDFTACRFERLFSGKDLDAFYEFFHEQAIPAGALLLTIPIEGDSLGWVFYPIESVTADTSSSAVQFGPILVCLPEDGGRAVPDEWKGYPVWRL
jgi:hypothetical protein